MYFYFLYLISFLMIMGEENWFLIWVGLEINMISFMMLMYQRFNQSSTEVCIKYFFVQSLGSAMFMSMFYVSGEFLSGLLVLVLSYKMGGGIFYYWLPSVCEGLSWMMCFILLTFQKMMPLLLMVMFMNFFMWLMILTSLILGAVGSLNQSSIKQLIVYSSVYHLGWIMLCSCVKEMFWVVYLLVYGMIIFGLMYLLSEMYIMNFFCMMKWKVKGWFIMGMLSMAGMPPLLGFFLKWMAFVVIISMSLMWMYMLIIMSLIMFYVYFWTIYDVLMSFKVQMYYLNKLFLYDYKFDSINVLGLISGLGLIIYMYMYMY